MKKFQNFSFVLGTGLAVLLCAVCFSAPAKVHAASNACVNTNCGGTYSNGFCSKNSYHYQAANKTTGKYDVDNDGVKDVVYEISNGGQLYWFADFVNNKNYDANAVLTTDITVNEIEYNSNGNLIVNDSFRRWYAMCSAGYEGVFNGQGHEIRGLYNDYTRPMVGSDTDYEKVGFFYKISESGVVRNLILKDCYFYSGAGCGGIAYENNGLVSSCDFSGNIYFSLYTASNGVGAGCVYLNYGLIERCNTYGNYYCMNNAGGIVVSNYGVIKECNNYAKVWPKGKNHGYPVGSAAGIAVFNEKGGTIQNCSNYGNSVGEDDYKAGSVYCGGIVSSNSGTIKNSFDYSEICKVIDKNTETGVVVNCYYLSENGVADTDVLGSVEGKTAKEFASGEVAYLLNGSTSKGDLVWFQTVGTAYPSFEGDIVYQFKDCAGNTIYSYTSEEDRMHVGGTATCVEKAACNVCGKKYGEIDAGYHAEKEVKNRVEATCTETGYTGDISCADCGMLFEVGQVIEAKGHNYTSAVTKEPTIKETGVLTYTCVHCDDTYTEVIEKLPDPAKGVVAIVTDATHWGNGGQVEITLTNGGEDMIDGWNIELDLNIVGELTNSWGDGYVTSFKDGHVTIKNQDRVQNFEVGTTKKIYLQYSGTLPGFVTCDQNGDALVASIHYLNHWGNGGQIEILLENTGASLNNGWGTGLTINLTGKMAGTWGDGFVTSYENGHIVIQNQDWVKDFAAGTKKSVWLQFDGSLPVAVSNVVVK